jgi:hypothetical protein
VLAIAGTLVLLPEGQACATELSGGVSVGGVLVGAMPRLAVTPHAALGQRMESGLLFAAHEVFSILPASDAHGVGVYSQTSADIGYAWDSVNVSLGPSLAIYSLPACAPTLCARVAGLAPGGHAQVSVATRRPAEAGTGPAMCRVQTSNLRSRSRKLPSLGSAPCQALHSANKSVT